MLQQQGQPHSSLGHSSNTSTSKHLDSTLAKKPSNSKEPTLNSQEKSPKAHGSRKHSRSPSPSTKSVRCKWKDVHTEDSHTLNTTLPISSSILDGLCSPTGSHSDATELLSPSITSTPLVLRALDNGKLHWMKVGSHWLHSTQAQTSTSQDTLQ